MKVQELSQFSGPPRSVVWPGGAVVFRRCSATQRGPDLHAHFALQLSVGFACDVSLRCGRCEAERRAAGWLIRSDHPHWLSGEGAGVTLFWDPVTCMGRRAATRLDDDAAPLTSEECAHILRELELCCERGLSHENLREAADRIAQFLARPGGAATPIDRRVQMVLRALQSDPTRKCSLAEFARQVKLSESRLAHLFRRDVGIALRQYRLTLRMEEAVREIAAGASLTRAAYAAGFADPAHFCRICRRMYGSPPSQLPIFHIEV